MENELRRIFLRLIYADDDAGPLSGIEIKGQFKPEEDSPTATLRNLNAAFLISLCGGGHPDWDRAKGYLSALGEGVEWGPAVEFFERGLSLVSEEVLGLSDHGMDPASASLENRLEELDRWIQDPKNLRSRPETLDKVWGVFFPEGVSLFQEGCGRVETLRKRRTVRIESLNPDPVREPGKEILFTSNILLTLPPEPWEEHLSSLPDHVKESVKRIGREPQTTWYDHPVQMGVEPDRNEIVYGLRGLDEAVAFEKERGTVGEGEKVNCLLSISVTHAGLKTVAKAYVESLLKKAGDIRHLNVYAFSEGEISRLVEEILIPAARRYLGPVEEDLLQKVVGVDGEYGRHFSFLKAIAAFWQVLLDPALKGTFKIDLDQVFPQRELVSETGSSAFEHFKTPLWGALGIDSGGDRVHLGMIAGALVNQRDVGRSVFTPDVKTPKGVGSGDEWIFFSPLPQALSTEAEMMTRYRGGKSLDGRTRCIQRIHVTGGTSGILVESLKRYRPFTPTFIGRAEDQAYLLSVLFEGTEERLRYVHEDGLIMRHDKEGFAQGAIEAARTGKLLGDYVRILLFSYYARGLPWPVEKTKEAVDPFTGCFVSYLPWTVVYLRLALKAASLFEGREKEAVELLEMGILRLGKLVSRFSRKQNPLRENFLEEKRGWDIYYDLLESLDQGLREGDSFALRMQNLARGLFESSRVL